MHGQDESIRSNYKKHGVVWTAGVWKSWLEDEYVTFDKIEDSITPIYHEEKKTGLMIQSNYMYNPMKWMGLGIHMGIGLDLHSWIEAPVVLFGGSFSIGKKNQFIIHVGWADAKRRKVPGFLKDQLDNASLTEIPTIANRTELNSAMYLGIGYRFY